MPGSGAPPSSFRTWMGQAQWSRQLSPEGVQLVARATVQRSADRLLALDGLAVGGVNTVRGYRENELVRDQGEYVNLEIDWPVTGLMGSNTRLHLVPFIDAGSAHNLGGSTQALSSLGLAVRVQWQGLQADLTIAKRLTAVDQSAGAANSLQGQGLSLQDSIEKVAEKFTYEKVETCCPFPTKRTSVGAGTLDIYEVTFEGTNKKIRLYFNLYEKGKIYCPNGFSIKKSPTLEK